MYYDHRNWWPDQQSTRSQFEISFSVPFRRVVVSSPRSPDQNEQPLCRAELSRWCSLKIIFLDEMPKIMKKCGESIKIISLYAIPSVVWSIVVPWWAEKGKALYSTSKPVRSFAFTIPRKASSDKKWSLFHFLCYDLSSAYKLIRNYDDDDHQGDDDALTMSMIT